MNTPLCTYSFGPKNDVPYSVIEVEGDGSEEQQDHYYEVLNGYGEVVTTGGVCFTVPSRDDVLQLLEGKGVAGGGFVGEEHRRFDLRQYEHTNRTEVSPVKE
jgi:hypothetical protein